MNIKDFKGVNTIFSQTKWLTLTISIVLVAACSNPIREKKLDWPDIQTKSQSQTKNAEATSDDSGVQTVSKQEQLTLQSGTDKYLGDEPLLQTKQAEKGVQLNFKAVDLNAFVQAVLGDILKQNFLIDPGVSGTVTIQTINPLPEAQLFDVLQEILALNGATLVRKESGYRVIPISQAAQSPLVPRIKKLKRQGFGIQIVPLRYISASEMEQILRPSLQNAGILYVDKRRNLLILKGTEEELTRMLDMISVFDVHWLEGKSIALFPLDYVAPNEIVTELSSALAGEKGQLFEGMVKLIPIKRVNSLLVVSHTRDYLRDVSNWIKRLDVANNTAGKRLYVYHLKNAKAVDIAETLSQIFEQGSSRARERSDAIVSPLDTPVTIGSVSETNRDEGRTSRTNTGTRNNQGVTLTDDMSVKIIADEKNNTLVIMCSASNYKLVESAIEQLDILPKQVLIEVTILDVLLTGELSYGVEWFFKNGGIDSNKTGRGQLSLGTDGVAAIAPGFSYSIVDQLGDVRAVLNALESESDVRILSSPSIMVLDNSSAEINVGDEIPIPTRQSTSNINPTAPTVNEIEYRDTGILLSVSPRINAGGLVTLEVNQEVSDAITTKTSGIDAPTISQRRINTTVAIQNGESILLGGLIRERQEDSRSGIPGLSRLPGIGNLFGQKSNSDRKSELLMILTPYVIENVLQAKAITEEYREKLIPELHVLPSASSLLQQDEE